MATLLGKTVRTQGNELPVYSRAHQAPFASQQQAPRINTTCRAQATAESVRVELSPELRKTTAVLQVPNSEAPGGVTDVYVLAMSHVSQKSCEQIRELIQEVKPEVVMVELCKDRVGLLATQTADGPQTWHCPKVTISGVPEVKGYPTTAALQKLLVCKPGNPITVSDIEGDAARLQSTGLFSVVKPGARPLDGQNAPMFWINPDDEAGIRIDTLSSLGQIEFRCTARTLPAVTSFSCIVDSSATDLDIDFSASQLEDVTQLVLAEADGEAGTTVQALMKAKAKLIDMAMSPMPFDVVYTGAETGKVTAVVKASKGNSETMSGLEASAEGGEGLGIVVFRNPNRSSDVKVGLTSRIPAAAIERIAESQQVRANLDTEDEDEEDGSSRGKIPEDVRAALKKAASKTEWRPWGWKELATVDDDDPEPQPLKDQLTETLTTSYGKLQSKAGETVGIEAGEAWRVAMEEGIRCGASQILLGDRPALTTQRRLAQGIWAALAPRGLFGVLALNLSVAAGSTGLISQQDTTTAVAVTFVSTLALLLPVALPFWEIFQFSKMGMDEIEEAVAVPEPVQENLDTPMKLYGEDALLDWPGASESIIAERDVYMARALVAAAQGTNGQVPAYVIDTTEGQAVVRYMMADGAPNKSAPTGKGDGAYQPVRNAKAVVAVIGSAHVRGICREWETAKKDVSVEELMKWDR